MKSDGRHGQLQILGYKAARGARFDDRDAAIIGLHLKRLSAAAPGVLSTEEVVRDAENPESPLHPFFEWDDTAAARAYRLAQARHLLNHIEVVVKTADGAALETKAFFNLTVRSENGEGDGRGGKSERAQGYIPMQVVYRTASMREQVVAQALQEVERWSERYRQYSELAKIVAAVDEVVSAAKLNRRQQRSSSAGRHGAAATRD